MPSQTEWHEKKTTKKLIVTLLNNKKKEFILTPKYHGVMFEHWAQNYNVSSSSFLNYIGAPNKNAHVYGE